VIGVAKHVASEGSFYLIMADEQGISYKIPNKTIVYNFQKWGFAG
jgi:hypothetical protein